jgi:hypothetical protein
MDRLQKVPTIAASGAPNGTRRRHQHLRHSRGREYPVRRLLVLVLSSAVLLAACGTAKSWPSLPPDGPSQAPSVATATEAATPEPTEVGPTEAPPTKAPPTKAPPTAAPTVNGNAFSPSGGGFSVVMPGEPKLTTQTYSTAVGDAPASLWTYEVSNDLALFVVQATYPKGSMTGAAPSLIFDGALNGMVANTTGAKITAKADTTLGGHPGKTFVLEMPTAFMKGALYIVGDSLYMVYAAYTSESSMTQVDAFLASFTFSI